MVCTYEDYSILLKSSLERVHALKIHEEEVGCFVFRSQLYQFLLWQEEG